MKSQSDPMSPSQPNGWNEHQRLVLYRLDRIEKRLDSFESSIHDLVTAERVRSLRVGVLSFAVAITTAFGGRAAWDILTKILF